MFLFLDSVVNTHQILTNIQAWLTPIEPMLHMSTNFGRFKFFLLFSAILYWSGFRALGARLAIGMGISMVMLGITRQFIPSPRPYWFWPELFSGEVEKGYGMPSGHSQNAVVFWGLIATTLKRPRFWCIATFMMVMAGLSRLYLGVHFPEQVLVGLLCGFVVLFLLTSLERLVIAFINAKPRLIQCVLVIVATGLPLAVVIFFREIIGAGAGNGEAMSYTKMCMYTGLLTGVCLGLLFAPKVSETKPSLQLFITQAIPGTASAILAFQLIPFVDIPQIYPATFYVNQYLEYVLLAVWGAAGWPLFHKLLLKS